MISGITPRWQIGKVQGTESNFRNLARRNRYRTLSKTLIPVNTRFVISYISNRETRIFIIVIGSIEKLIAAPERSIIKAEANKPNTMNEASFFGQSEVSLLSLGLAQTELRHGQSPGTSRGSAIANFTGSKVS